MRAAHFQCGFFYPIQQSTFEAKIDVSGSGEGGPETEKQREWGREREMKRGRDKGRAR